MQHEAFGNIRKERKEPARDFPHAFGPEFGEDMILAVQEQVCVAAFAVEQQFHAVQQIVRGESCPGAPFREKEVAGV